MRAFRRGGSGGFGAVAFAIWLASPALAQNIDIESKLKVFGAGSETRTQGDGVVITPRSSVPGAGRAHTNVSAAACSPIDSGVTNPGRAES